MKAKMKEFVKKHESDIRTLIYYSVGFGIGYFVGYKLTESRIGLGLSRCVAAKPELGPMLDTAIKEVAAAQKRSTTPSSSASTPST